MGITVTILYGSSGNYTAVIRRHQVAQSVQRQTLYVEVRGSKPVLVTWWWGWISPNQPNLKGYQVLDDQDLETDYTNRPISN